MNGSYPLALALFDFAPVAFFLIGAIFLVRIAIRMCGPRCGGLAIVGSLLIFMGGFLKAIWKLLFTIGMGDFQFLSESQFPLVAPGFLVLLIVVIMMARKEKVDERSSAVLIIAISTWKIPLLIIMTLASMGVQGILTFLAFRHKAKLAAVGFIVAFLSLVSMGALASGEQSLTVQWTAQSVNAVGQLGFMIGSIVLFKKVSVSQSLINTTFVKGS
jgi:hypothetical protein